VQQADDPNVESDSRFRGIARYRGDMTLSVLRNFPRVCPPPGWPNLVIDAAGRSVTYDEHSGPLTLKTVFRGTEDYRVGRISHVVRPGGYLVLNEGQTYSSTIRSEMEVESFSVFFNPSLLRDVHRTLHSSEAQLLNDSVGGDGPVVEFFERAVSGQNEVFFGLCRFRKLLRDGDLTDVTSEETLHDLLEALLRDHARYRLDVDRRLSAAKKSTRTEIVRRLHRVRDFLETSLGESIGLTEMAGVACLSKYHLQRSFKEAFRESPHQYLMRRRIEVAKHLLTHSELPIDEICAQVGYESRGSFSSLFLRRVGRTPLQYRGSRRSAQ
jgi:AraC-like DNA-binding protein